jgi:hypothetical protein
MQRGVDGMPLDSAVLIHIKALSFAGNNIWDTAGVIHLDGAASLLVEFLERGTHPLCLHPRARQGEPHRTKKEQPMSEKPFHSKADHYCSCATSISVP